MSNLNDPDEYELRRDYDTLLKSQALLERSRRSAQDIPDYVLAEEPERMERLRERAEQLGCDLDADINRWVERLMFEMTNKILQAHLDKSPHSVYPVWIRIGNPDTGYRRYRPQADAIEWGDGVSITLPDSVAEEFRQQGRRQLQRELAQALGVKSHL